MRRLGAEAKVTRIGPSPTGFIHLGNLYNAIIAERLAHQSNGKFFLRIEDKDNKREVQGAVKVINSALGYIDAIRGELNLPPNALDFVLLKSDRILTYHFVHVVDGHLMRTTHVIRGEEWLSSLPMHIQLFNTIQWEKPVYCYTVTLMNIVVFTGSLNN